MTNHPTGNPVRQLPAWVMCFALILPTGITWIYFVLLAQEPAFLQRSAYLMGKSLQCVLPLICICGWQRRNLSFPTPRRDDLALGLLTGSVIAGAGWLGYRYAFSPAGGFATATVALREKLVASQLDSRTSFIALACFYALVHSLFEEYYWRWFVFAELKSRLSVSTAAIISGVGFAAHHVLVLAAYFQGLSWLTVFFSFSVAVGGFLWAAMYQRSGRLYGVWLSHLLVDAMIFFIGYDLLRSSFGGQ
jgi:hypothetical protein